MDIKRAKQEIKDAAEAYFLKNEFGEYVIPSVRQRPIFLIGAPGIGKTQIMEQVAKECGLGLVSYTITHHTRQSAIGLPYISKNEYDGTEYEVTEYTMSEIVASVYEKMKKTGLREGILFIDEINCVSETLAPAMLQFLQCKSFGNHQIPKGWMIVAAGNPPEYNKSVREFDVVTMDRVKKIEVEPEFTVWKEYAYKENVHGAVISYLSTKPAYFYQMEMTVDGMRFATPRGWEDLSKMLQVYEKLGKAVDREVVEQYIQYPKIAKDFANYLELYHKYRTDYQIDAVLSGTMDEILLKKIRHASFDERLSVVSLILSKLTENFRTVYRLETQTKILFDCLKSYKAGLDYAENGVAFFSTVLQDSKLTENFRTVYRLETQTKILFDCLKSYKAGLDYAENGVAFFSTVLQDTIESYETKRKAELLNREEEYAYRKTVEQLESYEQRLKTEGVLEKEACFEKIREYFAKDKSVYTDVCDGAGQMLEYAFDFMELLFGESQEMVVFMTELNANLYSVQFLKEYDCPRYYQYNKNLLFDEREKNLLQRIEQL